jgi:peptidoglycan/xylan/chitin deacetylase (PgdA/CDA1 family)
MIGSLKRSSLALSRHLGVSRIVADSAWRRQRLLILCYHGIALEDEHRWDPSLYVSAAHLERRLTLLRKNRCAVLPLSEALERLYRNDLPDRAVVLTFDDGYYDFAARGWPLLQAYGYPGTVYLTTARVEHNFPIVHLFVSYMLWKARHQVLDGRGILGLQGSYALAAAEERERVVREMTDAVRRHCRTAADKDNVAREVAERLGLDHEALLRQRALTLMRAEEVGRLAREGVDVQLHTHLHRTPEDPETFVSDIIQNRLRIEAMTGRRPTHLCYPSGLYRAAYLPGLRREGIVSATTCDPGMASRTSDPLLLPRFIDTTSITDVEFEAWVTGIASCLPRRTRRAHPAVVHA